MNEDTSLNSSLIEDYINKFKVQPNNFKFIYNMHQKMQFINEQYGHQDILAQRTIIIFFNRIGKEENKLQKDLCYFNLIEIQNLFQELRIIRKSSFETRKTWIKQYFDWCIDKNIILPSQSMWLDNFNFEMLNITDSFKKKYFKSYEDLNAGINEVLGQIDVIDEHQFDIAKIAFYLSWVGLTTEEICNLLLNNIDYNKKCIIIKEENKTYSLNDDICRLLKDYLNTDGYDAYNSRKNSSKSYDYKSSNFVMRRLASSRFDRWNEGELQSKVSHMANVGVESLPHNNLYYGHKFYMKNIRESGQCFKIYQYILKSGTSIDNIDDKTICDLTQDNTLISSKRINFNNIFRDWASAFYAR